MADLGDLVKYAEKKLEQDMNPLHLSLTLDADQYEKLQYISDQTGLEMAEAAKWVLGEYLAFVFAQKGKLNGAC
jgi:hypothetical protein